MQKRTIISGNFYNVRNIFKEISYNRIMNTGMILLAWLVIVVVSIAALIASGIVEVKIQFDSDDDEKDYKDKTDHK